jgi:pyridoxal 4-dehydrogenase
MTGIARTAVITGAAGGLGAAFARALAAEGHRIAIVDIKPGEAVAAGIVAAGGEARAYHADITDPAAVAAAVAAVEADFGAIDVLVNNAGIYTFTPHETVTFELWRKLMALNTDGMFLMTGAVIPGMKARGWGRIINIASNSCFIPPPGLSAYVASKSAVLGYMRSLAGELGRHGITVNAVAPGPTVTEQLMADFPDQAAFEQFMAQFVETQAVKRLGQPADCAPAVCFFAGEAAGFITGQTLVVDGGLAFH